MSADSKLLLPGRTQSAEEIRRELEQARAQIQSSVAALREEVSVATEWRGWYRRDPLLWVGAAFAVGLYLGIRSSNR